MTITDDKQAVKALGMIVMELRTGNIILKDLIKRIDEFTAEIEGVNEAVMCNADSTDSLRRKIEDIDQSLQMITDGLNPLYHIQKSMTNEK